MVKRLLLLLSAAVLLGLPNQASAGHEFTQGSTNTPVWLQAGQAVFAEQFYSSNYDDYALGSIRSIGFGPADTIPTDADTTTTSWSDFDAGDVIRIDIGTEFSLTLAYDASDTCGYDFCGWQGDEVLPQADTPYDTAADYMRGWGATILPALDNFDINTSGTLSLAELQAVSTLSAFGSAKYFLGADIGLVTYGGPQTLDADLSGTLSADEITAFNAATYDGNPVLGGENGSALVNSFATYDIDSSGALSQSELNAALLSMQFAAIDADTSGDISDDEMFSYIWRNSYSAFHYNSDGSEGMFNQFGTTFTAVAGQFSLYSYRIVDANGYQLHGAGSGPIDQDSVCIPPNCGPSDPAPSEVYTGPSDVGTAVAVIEQHRVEREAMRQAERVLVGVSELQVDVNFDSAPSSKRTTASSMGGGDIEGMYRWAVRADGAFSSNAELGDSKTGSLVLAYGLKSDLDLGVYTALRNVDLSLNGSGFQGNMNAYGVYLRRRDDTGQGLQWKASLATTSGNADLSRAENSVGADAAFGTANLQGRAASVEFGYGASVQGATLTPFARIAYSSMTRGAYVENSATEVPITYGEFTQKSTTVTVGVSGEKNINDTDSLFGSIYAVSDLRRSNNGLSGTSTIPNLENFDLASEEQRNAVRLGTDVTFYHRVGDRSRIYGGLSAQKEADVDSATVSFNFGFEARY